MIRLERKLRHQREHTIHQIQAVKQRALQKIHHDAQIAHQIAEGKANAIAEKKLMIKLKLRAEKKQKRAERVFQLFE